MQLILGSQSPRRKEILSYFGIPFEQVTSSFDEDAFTYTGNPVDFAIMLSKGKCQAIAQNHPNAIILTADTIVVRNGKSYGKPKDKEEAFSFLKELSGNWHSVFTAVTVRNGNKDFSDTEETRVLFNDLSDEHIRHYIDTLHFYDKAGGYAVQEAGGLIVRKIDGCFYNVMGLPINTAWRLLKHVNIDLWEHIR